MVDENLDRKGLWVFGYGSLCWNPGFEYGSSVLGHVTGFARRFWQGNSTHRGTEEKPGRVATLIEEKDAITWGRAFQLKGEAALTYLDQRECTLGGYRTHLVPFFVQASSRPPIQVLVYVATKDNKHWLGPAPLTEVATQVVYSSGKSGHNVEYVLRLAEFMRENLPDIWDDHLFTLEKLVRTRVKEGNMCLKTLMGEKTRVRATSPENDRGDAGGVAQAAANEPRPDSFQFISRVPPKKLRCLNV